MMVAVEKEKECAAVSAKTDMKAELIGSEEHAKRGINIASVIVMLPLLLALITFFVRELINLGAEVVWDYTNLLGVFVLNIRVNDRVFEWTTSTFVTQPGNRSRLYVCDVLLLKRHCNYSLE